MLSDSVLFVKRSRTHTAPCYLLLLSLPIADGNKKARSVFPRGVMYYRKPLDSECTDLNKTLHPGKTRVQLNRKGRRHIPDPTPSGCLTPLCPPPARLLYVCLFMCSLIPPTFLACSRAGVVCDGCDRAVVGLRLKCSTCPDYGLN